MTKEFQFLPPPQVWFVFFFFPSFVEVQKNRTTTEPATSRSESPLPLILIIGHQQWRRLRRLWRISLLFYTFLAKNKNLLPLCRHCCRERGRKREGFFVMESHCGEEAQLWLYFLHLEVRFWCWGLWSADFLVAYLRLHLLWLSEINWGWIWVI